MSSLREVLAEWSEVEGRYTAQHTLSLNMVKPPTRPTKLMNSMMTEQISTP